MAYARGLHMRGALVMCGLLLVGCTAGGNGGDTKTGATADASTDEALPTATASPTASPTFETDPAKQPRTADQARRLIRKVIAGPELFGQGVVRTTPYESDPTRWALLGDGCAWQLENLPAGVLATLTRHFEVPAGGGKGPVRLAATITVHRTTLDAAWEQAGMVEESFGCQKELLRPGEQLTELSSTVYARGEGHNDYSDESLEETGLCVSDSRGGPYPYKYDQAALGPVVVSTSVCGGRGRAVDDLWALVQRALPRMLLNVKYEIGSPAALGAASPEPETSAGTGTSTPKAKSDPEEGA
ncbi:hypothetical protein ABT404_33325 [Streptomyces hyaluromycini]|uniref:Lipoprotein n=1 Tax=Streptomyces hyaluromycini TaxID=1377993 RepID=A0ABV1X5J6_9ACTN